MNSQTIQGRKPAAKGSGHVPVMLTEILQFLGPALSHEGLEKTYLDGTFGRGGHTRGIMAAIPDLRVVALDRDLEAVEYATAQFQVEIENESFQIHHQNFSDFDPAKLGLFDAILVDLGVSSPQLDEGRRGFSFYHDGPLDMRMDTTQGPTAADLVQILSEEDLNELFKELGEIQKPYRVTRAIVNDRKVKPFATTRELASLIERVEGWHRKGFHPATQYFMALRLRVNQELEAVTAGVEKLLYGLKPRGRLAVLTFHSLEDRIVKNLFKSATELGVPLTKKVVQPSWDEQKVNPRARSAKLRVFERHSH